MNQQINTLTSKLARKQETNNSFIYLFVHSWDHTPPFPPNGATLRNRVKDKLSLNNQHGDQPTRLRLQTTDGILDCQPCDHMHASQFFAHARNSRHVSRDSCHIWREFRHISHYSLSFQLFRSFQSIVIMK